MKNIKPRRVIESLAYDPQKNDQANGEPLSDFDVFITVSFFDSQLEKMDPKRQFGRTAEYVRRALKDCGRFEMYPEFTLAGRIHYHIMLKVHDKGKYAKAICLIKRHCGNTKAEYIKDLEKVRSYCNKDVASYTKLLKVKLPLTESYGITPKGPVPPVDVPKVSAWVEHNQPKCMPEDVSDDEEEDLTQAVNHV